MIELTYYFKLANGSFQYALNDFFQKCRIFEYYQEFSWVKKAYNWINFSATTCAALILSGTANTKLVILHVATNRYL